MNKLQRRAWINLIGSTACVAVAGAGIGLAVRFNAGGLVPVISFVIASYAFVLFLCFASFTIFFISGARNNIPGYTLPVLLLIGIFISQFVQSAVILLQFTREQADGQ